MDHADTILSPRKPGRPLSFDRDAALDRAMRLFWQHGYESTSLSALTAAMGITPPSLYAAFGDKKRLFLAAVERYLGDPIVLDETTIARQAAHDLLCGAAIRFTGTDTPPGCLVATAAISCSAEAADVRTRLAAVRLETQDRLRQWIARDVEAGLLPPHADPDGLAAHVMAVVQGMSTLARDGASRETLTRVADIAMMAWPS